MFNKYKQMKEFYQCKDEIQELLHKLVKLSRRTNDNELIDLGIEAVTYICRAALGSYLGKDGQYHWLGAKPPLKREPCDPDPMASRVEIAVTFEYDNFDFEGKTDSTRIFDMDDIGELAKNAATLTEHTISRYKKAKRAADNFVHVDPELSLMRIKIIRNISESEWTLEQKAIVKAWHEYKNTLRNTQDGEEPFDEDDL